MSDKPYSRLNDLDQILRDCFPVKGFCSDHVQVTIEKICGFELFNTRPYHNYESWSDGYRIFLGDGSDKKIFVEAEDLDTAIYKLREKIKEVTYEFSITK